MDKIEPQHTHQLALKRVDFLNEVSLRLPSLKKKKKKKKEREKKSAINVTFLPYSPCSCHGLNRVAALHAFAAELVRFLLIYAYDS